jgi:hypothetical protein
LAGLVSVKAGVQVWSAPVAGRYAFYACGAQGASATEEFLGGLGACVGGSVSLAAGEVVRFAVGQVGLGGASGTNGGGGGGTFVVSEDEVPLFVAGGGGGTRGGASQSGCDAVASTYGVIGSGDADVNDCDLRGDGAGEGGGVSSESYGAGGAGFYSDGTTDGDPSEPYGLGGRSWANGLGGGDQGTCGAVADGGFGGGGAGNGCWGGGGGGGYSGGDGGWVAGGGGSWNSDASGVAYDGANTGDGYVIVRLESME